MTWTATRTIKLPGTFLHLNNRKYVHIYALRKAACCGTEVVGQILVYPLHFTAWPWILKTTLLQISIIKLFAKEKTHTRPPHTSVTDNSPRSAGTSPVLRQSQSLTPPKLISPSTFASLPIFDPMFQATKTCHVHAKSNVHARLLVCTPLKAAPLDWARTHSRCQNNLVVTDIHSITGSEINTGAWSQKRSELTGWTRFPAG